MSIQNRTNFIKELQQYIEIAKEDIGYKSIEEFNEYAIWYEKKYSSYPCEKFHNIILHKITGKSLYSL